MAKQTGLIPLNGTLEGINFYMRKGKPVARKAGGGFTGKAIKMSPRMGRVRDNNSEFGHCSQVKKIFKNSLFPFFRMEKDGELHGRMMKLFMAIKNLDGVSERGKRRIDLGLQTAEGKQLLTSFEFTPYPLILRNAVYDADSFTYTVSPLEPFDLSYRNGATHLELTLGEVVLDFEGLKATLFASDTILISKDAPLPNLSLTPIETPAGNGMRITILGHRYMQELNGAFYPLKEKVVYGVQVLGVE